MRITEISIPLEALRAILPDESGGIKITLHEGYSLLDYLGGARDGAAGSASPGKESSGGRMLFGLELLGGRIIRWADRRPLRLSKKAFGILESLAAHDGTVSFLDLATEVWGESLGADLLSQDTVRKAIERLRDTLVSWNAPIRVWHDAEIAYVGPSDKTP